MVGEQVAYSGVNADLSTFGWGEAADSGTTATVRVWSHDNFGEDLLINPRDGVSFIGIKPMALVQEPWLSLL